MGLCVCSSTTSPTMEELFEGVREARRHFYASCVRFGVFRRYHQRYCMRHAGSVGPSAGRSFGGSSSEPRTVTGLFGSISSDFRPPGPATSTLLLRLDDGEVVR